MIAIQYFPLPGNVSLILLISNEQVFEEYSKFDKVLAAFYEAVRLFRKYWFSIALSSSAFIPRFITAAGYVLIREAEEDTVLQIPNPLGQDGSTAFPVPKGVQVRRSRSSWPMELIVPCRL